MLSADGTATLYNYGEITTHVAAAAQEGASIGGLYGAYASNGGSIVADAYAGADFGVTALYAYSPLDNVVVVNQAGGSISGTGDGGQGVGIYAHSYGAAIVNNDGTVSGNSSSGAGLGIVAYAVFGPAAIDNGGSVDAYSETGHSLAVDAISVFYDASVDNSGTISASSGDYAGGALAVSLYGNASIDNTGSIDASSPASDAYGAVASAKYYGDASVYNAGTIVASGSGNYAFGAIASAYAGAASLDNDGDVYADTDTGYALGARVYGATGAAVDNSGTIEASGVFATAVRVETLYGGTLSAYNSGHLHADAVGSATGLFALGYGDMLVDNSGTIVAESDNMVAVGIEALSFDAVGPMDVYNSGSISASSDLFFAYGISARDFGGYGDVSVDNSGTIEAEAAGRSFGILVASHDGTAQASNSGHIYVHSDDYIAAGIRVYSNGQGDVSASNTGSIEVEGYLFAHGIDVREYGLGSVYAYNDGSIVATSDLVATGIFAQGNAGYVEVLNTGDISAYAGISAAFGIEATGGSGGASVYNGGHVLAQSEAYYATGISVRAFNSDVRADNTGDVDAFGSSQAVGIELYTSFDGDAQADNSGRVYAYALGDAIGVQVDASGAAAVYNSGSIEAKSVSGPAVAGQDAFYGFDFYVYNNDTLVAGSVFGDATGVYGSVSSKYGTAGMVNLGSVEASSIYGDALGVHLETHGKYGVSELDNTGTISAIAGDAATAVYLLADGANGHVEAYNGGSFFASGGEYATGALLVGGKYAALTNAGDIYAIAEYGSAAAAVGAGVASFYGDAQLHNSGTITALAYSDTDATAVGGFAAIYGGNSLADNSGTVAAQASGYFSGDASGLVARSSLLSATVYNSGLVFAQAEGQYADAVGAYATAGEGAAVNTTAGSSISAVAIGFYDADAFGAHATGLFANVYGEGAISASASADMEAGDARAYGAFAYGNFTGVYNLGEGEISAVAQGAYALAVGAWQDGYFTAFHNEGDIHASATGDSGFAIGSATRSYYTARQYNDGDIAAVAHGEEMEAVGLFASSRYGDVDLYNTGTISASSDFLAIAVQLRSDTYTYIYNEGAIVASGAGTNVAIYSDGTSADTILNYGSITGALRLGEGDDYLYNGEGATWHATGYSYLGYGDDTIRNYGTIAMQDSVIDLGYHAVNGNYFYNYGTITVSGAGNVVDMGDGPQALVPSLNPNAFYNGVGGVIDFQDGDPDDELTIVGDFAGDGDINVDVSGLTGQSDTLYIDGSVVAGTVGTINVDLGDLPEEIETLVPIVYVTGNSVAGNFVLGEVDWDEANSFVTLDFDLVADIDASNATPDVFALGIEVSGLSDPGTLAAAVPGAVQSLMNSSVGTWRQRMGVIDGFVGDGLSLWARVWTDKGGFSPEHHASNFGDGGNFAWDQKNSGVEAGIDFEVTDEFFLGLLVGKSQADVGPDDPGTGSADLDAATLGIYGTWISPTGFYLDASYRWMSFDADLSSVAGAMSVDGDAESFNLELGYAWTLKGGLQIEPQLQYTKTNVDSLDVLTASSGMEFASDGGESSRGRLGVAVRKGFGRIDEWLWTPYATLSAVREFDGENLYAINDSFFGETDLEGTSTLLEIGFTARHQNWSIYGGLNWQHGGAVENFFGGQLGVRYSFGAPPPAPVQMTAAPAKTCADLDDDGDGINNCDDKCATATGEAVGADGCAMPAPTPEPAIEPKPYRG